MPVAKTAQETPKMTISPNFARAIPAAIESSLRSLHLIEAALQPAAEVIETVQVFMDFEIEKAEHALEKSEWSSKADVEFHRRKLNDLRDIRVDVDAADLKKSEELIKRLVLNLRALAST